MIPKTLNRECCFFMLYFDWIYRFKDTNSKKSTSKRDNFDDTNIDCNRKKKSYFFDS